MNTLPSSEALIVPDWPASANVRALVTTRLLPGNSQPPFDAMNLGLRSGESEDVVRANRVLLIRALALPSAPRWLRQVHGTTVVAPDRSLPACGNLPPLAGEGKARDLAVGASSDTAGEPEADAAITRERGVVLAVLTADCLPILLCADDGSEVAAVHAGWRGLSAGVLEACAGRMLTAPERLLAWLAPAIGPLSFEVGDEVRAAFLARDESAGSAFAPTRPGHWTCDLYALARRRLGALGITRVFGGGFDTRSDLRFYSYRRDGVRSGRFASLVWTTA